MDWPGMGYATLPPGVNVQGIRSMPFENGERSSCGSPLISRSGNRWQFVERSLPAPVKAETAQ